MKRVLLTVLLATSLVALTACTAGYQSSSSGSSTGQAPVGTQPDGPRLTDESGSQVVADQRVVTTGSMTIRTEDPANALDEAARIVEDVDGRIADQTVEAGTDTYPPRATATLRIPSYDLDGALRDLRQLGTVVSVTIDRTDVTQESQDLDARIGALRTSVDRLLALMASATTTADLITIESTLSERQSQLDSLVAQRDYLADQVDYATLSLNLLSEKAPSTGPTDFWGGLVVGWNALADFSASALVALGVMLPWLGVLVVLAGIVLLIVLLATRASRRRTPPAA